MNKTNFAFAFKTLTGNSPFPWQADLYENWFSQGKFPDACTLPTGLGKTNVIAVWLLALANGKPVPRRLVYVVNRRTVVDQTTTEVEKFKNNLPAGVSDLALSTLRGQFADNREWSADPSRPAVICGTVDMIGSRLLFSGYGIGFKSRPLHAGFLGQDVLLVHDEAHLEPAFQKLIESIRDEQKRCKEFTKFHVMELTATSRGEGNIFKLSDADQAEPEVKKRIEAKKAIHLHENKDEKKLADEIAAIALTYRESGRAVLIFVRKVEDVEKIVAKLNGEKQSVQQLTGTLRGLERDGLVEDAIFKRFLPTAVREDKTVYLVCTSAGEVGVNISADHLVCDLSTFDSMAQRFGRVNRFGNRDDTRIDIVHPKGFDEKGDPGLRMQKTLALLVQLKGDGSPAALGKLDPVARVAAFAVPPTILPVTDILFDAWSLTTIKGKLPGRPIVEPYLHGIGGWEPPETHVAWREEVSKLAELQLSEKELGELLDDYPLKPHELLREPSYRAFKQLEAIAKRVPDAPAWLVDDDGNVEVLTVANLADKDEKERIEGKTVLLPPSVGGLKAGMLEGNSAAAVDDVADSIFADEERTQLLRIRVDDPKDERANNMRLIRRIDFPSSDEDAEGESWYWFSVNNFGEKSAKLPVLWRVHVDDVIGHARAMIANLPLDQKMRDAVDVAAQLHDHGKIRRQFQAVLNNRNYPAEVLAKSGSKKGARISETYRHEFGSLLESENQGAFTNITDPDMKELVLHLIATHHGRGRPHFPEGEAFDPEPPRGSNTAEMAVSVPRRFARLQRKYGRWGLAYLESLLRAADWAASANPSHFVEDAK